MNTGSANAKIAHRIRSSYAVRTKLLPMALQNKSTTTKLTKPTLRIEVDMAYKPEIVKASLVHPRPFMLVYGPPHAGKTTLALQFPKPIVLDLENGTQFYGDKFDFSVPKENPRTAQEFFQFMRWLATESHGFKTLVIDPITLWNQANMAEWLQVFATGNQKENGKAPAGQKSGKFETDEGIELERDYYKMQISDWNYPKADDAKLFRLMRLLDMNVICTAHEKDEYAEGGLAKTGRKTFDANKKFEYAFDTIVRVYRNGNNEFKAFCEKDRSEKLAKFKEFTCDYKTFEQMLGKERIERDSQAKIFSTQEQRDTMMSLADALGSRGVSGLKKAMAALSVETLADMTSEQAQDLINRMNEAVNKLKKENANATS